MKTSIFLSVISTVLMFCACDVSSPEKGVQLWDGGPYWAQKNLLASSPEDFGGYFAWGETESFQRFGWGIYKYCEKYQSRITKYNSSDGKMCLEEGDDAATVLLGEQWRMPSEAEFDALREKCKWTWTKKGKSFGYKITGPNAKSIFLPAGGYYSGSTLKGRDDFGRYWTCGRDSAEAHLGVEYVFISDRIGYPATGGRDCGRLIRAVSDNPYEISAHFLCDNSFTGRGNEDEILFSAALRSAGKFRVDEVECSVDAASGDVDEISVFIGDRKVDKCKYEGPGKYEFLLSGAVVLYDDILTVRFSVASDAVEGGVIKAGQLRFRADGKEFIAPEGTVSVREILLARKCLYRPGDYGSNFWRIPALRQLSDGTLLAVNDRRNVTENDLPEKIDVVYRYSTDKGKTWSKPGFIARNGGVMHGFGDPSLVECPDGTVICFFAGGETFRRSVPDNPQKSFYSISRDHGRTWSEPVEITTQIWGATATNPYCARYSSSFFSSGNALCLSSGRVLVANVLYDRNTQTLSNHVVYSDDNGASWKISNQAFEPGDEAKMVELLDGKILMSIRRRGERGWALSSDGGENWTERGLWDDINVTNCNGDLIRYNSQILLQTVPNSNKRENVSVFVSYDEGKTWPYSKSICKDASAYSSITVLSDGTIGAYLEEKSSGMELWYENFSIHWLLNHSEK